MLRLKYVPLAGFNLVTTMPLAATRTKEEQFGSVGETSGSRMECIGVALGFSRRLIGILRYNSGIS